jgi:hypothetical protein
MADEQDEPISPEREKILEARREARAALPAVFVDTWSTLTWKGHIRTALGEWLVGEPHYRLAFVMSLDDAKEFAEALLRRIVARQEKDGAREAAAQTPDGET